LETWDNGARRLLTLKISRRRFGGQPAVEPHRPLRTPCSSRCCLQVYRCGLQVADAGKVKVYGPAIEAPVTLHQISYLIVDCKEAGPGTWICAYVVGMASAI